MLGPAVHRGEDVGVRGYMAPTMLPKSCANRSNIVALRFSDHGTNEMLGVAGSKVWAVSSFAQQLPTKRNNMQQVMQMDATCNIQQCCIRLRGA